jgi:hypothetical protein
MAQVVRQRRALRLERLQRVGGEDRVLPLRVQEDEVLALRALVVAGDGQGVPGEPEVAPGPVLDPGQLQGRHRVRVPTLAEGNPSGEEVEGLVLFVALAKLVQLGARGDVVLVVEELLERPHPGAQIPRRASPAQAGREEEQGRGGSPHFTSSS